MTVIAWVRRRFDTRFTKHDVERLQDFDYDTEALNFEDAGEFVTPYVVTIFPSLLNDISVSNVAGDMKQEARKAVEVVVNHHFFEWRKWEAAGPELSETEP